MIDTDKYEGHTPAPWTIRTAKVKGQTKMKSFFIRHYTNTERGISKLICSMQGIHKHNADAELIADAPLLLERVIHLEHILKCAKDVLTNIYTYDKDLEDAEWIAWFCDMEGEEE